MSRHKQFYKDLKHGDYTAHPDEFHDEDEYDHEHAHQEYVCYTRHAEL